MFYTDVMCAHIQMPEEVCHPHQDTQYTGVPVMAFDIIVCLFYMGAWDLNLCPSLIREQ